MVPYITRRDFHVGNFAAATGRHAKCRCARLTDWHTLTYFDHAFVLLFALLSPLAGFIGFRRLQRRFAAGQPIDRHQLYRNTIAAQWIMFGMLLLLWTNAGRAWETLGMGVRVDVRFLVGMLLAAAGILFLIAQLREVLRAEQSIVDNLSRQLGHLAPLVPQNGSELARFYAVSLTAGVVEEALWRGFLIWYLAQYFPLWSAVLVSTIGFGLAHAYQGAGNLLRITLVGGALAGLYLLTGSVWLPMILHAAIDLLQGRVAYEISRRSTVLAQPVSS